MENASKFIYPAGRTALGVLFFVSGLFKIVGFAGVAGWMASAGLPFASALLVATIAVEVLGGALLIIGFKAKWAALALALFLIPATFVFHAFWSAEPAQFQDQLTAFMKNLAILGGMLLVIERGFRSKA
jgi:putative oxidoreductase